MTMDMQDIIIDSAVLIVNGAQLTASRGGWSFDEGAEWEDFAFPGRTMSKKRCRELVRLKPTIKGSALMTSEGKVSAYRPAGTWSDSEAIEGVRIFTPNPIRADLTLSDYLTNVFIVWKRQRGDYFAVEFPYAICSGWSIGATDADEGLIPITIEAAQNPASGTTKTRVPYRLHTLPGTTLVGDL